VKKSKIKEIRITPASIPVQAPLRYSTGVDTAIHRLVVEVETNDGLVGLGECNAGGSREACLRELVPQILDTDPFHTERLRWQIGNPVEAKLFGSVNHAFAAIEMACMDIQGQAIGRPVCDLLGGKIRDRIPLSAYLFYRRTNERNEGGISDSKDMSSYAAEVIATYGFKTLKLKAGVLDPDEELRTITQLREQFPKAKLRVDPNGAWSIGTTLHFANQTRVLNLEYLEDPVWGLRGMARVNSQCPWLPLASNMSVATPDDFSSAIALAAVDVILVDPHFYGGLRQARYAATTLELFQVDLSMHSQGEFGISMAAQLHLASVMPGLTYAADAHYHHLIDDIISGGLINCEEGEMRVPSGPGLGVTLDRDKLKEFSALAGNYRSALQTSITGDPMELQHIPVLPRW
jgi:glucarate dehydratase